MTRAWIEASARQALERLAGIYLPVTAAFTAGCYLAPAVETAEMLRFGSEALYVWLVLFVVPYIAIERAAAWLRGPTKA